MYALKRICQLDLSPQDDLNGSCTLPWKVNARITRLRLINLPPVVDLIRGRGTPYNASLCSLLFDPRFLPSQPIDFPLYLFFTFRYY